jgi:hypothetical protein
MRKMKKACKIDRIKGAGGSEEPTVATEHSGKWIAWRPTDKVVLAAADTYAEIMQAVGDPVPADLVIEKAPGVHRAVAERKFQLLDDESPDILEEVRSTIPDADRWLSTPNTRLWFEKPRDVIGTPREVYVRYLLRGIRNGITS